MTLRLPWKLIFSLAGLLLHLPAAAQLEFANWYFGQRAGLTFKGGPARVLTDGAMVSGEGCATISDAQGNLLFYTNGLTAWNRLHHPLAGGTGLGAPQDSTRTEAPPNSATQGVTIVPQPGSTTRYYIFTVDAAENGLRGGLRYAVVDMARQGGLGEVISKDQVVPVPLGDGRLTEKLVAVRHANQQDIWLVVHGWNSNVFLSYLLTATGVAPMPVVSAGGAVHAGGTNRRQDYNSLGYLKVAPTGQRLALVRYTTGPVELFDFNYGTGVVSGPRSLPALPALISTCYGLEFSPDGNLLYVGGAESIGANSRLYQFNLQTNALTEVGRTANTNLWALQLGPDQKLYGALAGAPFGFGGLCTVSSPNTPGIGCQFQVEAVPGFSSAHKSLLGLPNVLVRPPVPGQLLVNFGLLRSTICLGEDASFSASLYPAIPDAVVTWDFGEPTAGTANAATGRQVQHRYASPGTYQATMTVREVSGAVHTYAQTVTVLALTVMHLAVAPSTLCAGDAATLTVTPAQPLGTTYRWQDNSTGTQLTARTQGRYWVEVTAPQRCPVRDSVTLTFAPRPQATLGPDRRICAGEHVLLSPGAQPPGTTYRWQDGSTAASFDAQAAGTYRVTVTSAAGCASEAQVKVRFGEDCPFMIPNIITPNGDQQNEAFVLQGLEPDTWTLTVYNRWGRAVYQQARYHNQWDAAGQANGLYYYLLVQPVTGQRHQGWVEVQR